ncbi:MAG: hypothetical protein KBT03_13710 [Bacteroidales bacterium]|nr:hypothetical protein [Candidatus Scybalousia scybalohippi]
MVDVKQQELDFFEQQVLTDIFGGYNQESFVFRYGFFKFDLAPKVQKAINDMEKLIYPLMDDEGYINSSDIKKYVNDIIINVPDGRYRLIDLYRKCQPFLISAINYVKG